jgi:GTP-binding protein
MKIQAIQFITSSGRLEACPPALLPEASFVGRSNVGKSSLLNSLFGRKGLAKTSRTPGKTRLINFFLVDDAYYFADLPGYGYAKVPAIVKKSWAPMIEDYLAHRETLRVVVLLLDARHAPSVADQQMKDWLDYHQRPVIFVATKIDKISRNQKTHAMEVIRKELKLKKEDLLIPFSAKTDAGRYELLRALENYLKPVR